MTSKELSRGRDRACFFSICIPQYNRTSFILETCKSLMQQTYSDFEICISDDCSTDGREEEILELLRKSSVGFVYRRQKRNRRYDANLRASMTLAHGQYCFLLGNDDALEAPDVLEDLHHQIQEFQPVDVAITNYREGVSGKTKERIRETGILGTGPEAAAAYFRNFSFVGGVVLHTQKAKQYATSRWDGSEMYQMFVGCRMIAQGGRLLGIRRVTVCQGVQVPGLLVDSYADRPRIKAPFGAEQKIPLSQMGRMVADALEPTLNSSNRQKLMEKIFAQIVLFPYVYWLFEYRRVQSWNYAFGIYLGMRPRHLWKNLKLSIISRVRLGFLYGIASMAGLLLPRKIFFALERRLYAIAKAVR